MCPGETEAGQPHGHRDIQGVSSPMDDKVNVCFGVANYGPLWAPAVSSWIRAVAYAARYFEIQQMGKLGGAGITDRQYTHQAENGLAEDFIDNKDFTHLFFTESDMILPHDAIVKLVDLDKDMASGVYFLRSDNHEVGLGQPCLYKRPLASWPDDNYGQIPVSIFPEDKPFQVDCVGFGCVLFKRKVFEGLKKPYFNLDANKYGSDMYFYHHARKAGFELWVDPTVQCGQIDYYETTIQDWRKRLTNKDISQQGWIIGT